MGYFQSAWMVNYPGPEVAWTRIAEYKHMPNQPKSALNHRGTVIYREYSTDQGDPYYPVPNDRNRALYRKYQELAGQEPNVIFIGRLASYKYFNMDQVINYFRKNLLELFMDFPFSGHIDSFRTIR
jgi:UDP-galactopyranose mutase